MYNDSNLGKKAKPAGLPQLLAAIVIVLSTLVIPIQLIEINKQTSPSPYSVSQVANNEQTGRVAGVSTQQQSQQLELGPNALAFAGGAMLLIGLFLGVYLLRTSTKPESST